MYGGFIRSLVVVWSSFDSRFGIFIVVYLLWYFCDVYVVFVLRAFPGVVLYLI
jgi:hypothetical protein